jgi:chemotaxis response regulator CheB
MSRIRILIGAMPRMLRDILEEVISSQPDMQLIEVISEPPLSAAAIAVHHPDIVIVSDEGADLNAGGVELPEDYRRLGVLVLSRAGRQARFVDWRQRTLPDVSPSGLIESIRREFAGDGGV